MFTADHIANEYAKFKGGTEKAENNKRSILRHLELGGFDGVTKPKPVREEDIDSYGRTKKVWKTYYHYDMPKLFKKFGFVDDEELVDDDETAATPAASVASAVDCDADITAWEAGRAGDNSALERGDDSTDGFDHSPAHGEAGPSGTEPAPMHVSDTGVVNGKRKRVEGVTDGMEASL